VASIAARVHTATRMTETTASWSTKPSSARVSVEGGGASRQGERLAARKRL
jgi:hypothetical protein